MSHLKVFAPYDGQLIDKVAMNDDKDVEAALALAYQTYLDRDHWLKPYERISILEKTASLMQARIDALALAAATEGGKPWIDSMVEAERAIMGVKTAIAHIPQLIGRQIPMNLSPNTSQRIAYTYRESGGVVLAISAFNHPLNLIVHQVIPAIAVGAPVIIKPAAKTPLSCVNLVNILYEAGLPKAWCQMLVCERALTEKMVSDSRISFMSFIGSSKVGWYLRSKLAPGAACSLEHGGIAPVIVEADADVDTTLLSLVKGGFYHAGQVCVSVQRVFVHSKMIKTFTRDIVQLTKKLITGDPRDKTTEVGPLITENELKRVDEWVHQAVQEGAHLLCGGKLLSKSCYEPTILLDPSPAVAVSQEEIFGPVICIYTYKDVQEAIVRANQGPFCFQASVFTQNIDRALDIVQRLKATAVMVNDNTAFRADWMPFGGRLQSGLAMGGIPYAMHDMSYEKLMVIRSKSLNVL